MAPLYYAIVNCWVERREDAVKFLLGAGARYDESFNMMDAVSQYLISLDICMYM
jgi:hypothetical protein